MPGKVTDPPLDTSLVMSPVIASRAAPATFLSAPISSAMAATNCAFVICFVIFASSACIVLN